MSRANLSPATQRGVIVDWFASLAEDWNRFWFQPAEPHSFALIRVLTGAMLLYTHAVWSIGLMDFLGPNAWIDRETAISISSPYFLWSPLFYIDHPALLWTYHLASLVVMFLLMIGWRTRITSVLAWLFAVSYCHRLQGSLFGLDQANTMLAMYLMVGECGAAYSIDRWLARRRGETSEPAASVSTNIALRLMQIHLCVIYLFSAIGKMKGESWWDGSAVWFAVASLEYQSADLTWLARYPLLIALFSHVTVFWELSYSALIWPRRTRPIMLAVAAGVHGGIAFALGMITFGMAMLFANLSFVPARTTRAVVDRIVSLGGLGKRGG